MNFKKTLHNINLSKTTFFNLKSGRLNLDIFKNNTFFYDEYNHEYSMNDNYSAFKRNNGLFHDFYIGICDETPLPF
jgi:hypothetical protein